jgi:hypothetical protein
MKYDVRIFSEKNEKCFAQRVSIVSPGSPNFHFLTCQKYPLLSLSAAYVDDGVEEVGSALASLKPDNDVMKIEASKSSGSMYLST